MRGWLTFACALVVALVAATIVRGDPSPVPRRPNVIVYLVDTLRADHLGVYGYYRDTTPVLDEWAKGGVVFERAYAPCSWTKPSVVSLLTGLDPVSHGVEDRLDVIAPGVPLLSEQLRSDGYATFAAVTNPNVLPQFGFGRGFDVYEDLDSAGHGTRADAVSDWTVGRLGELAQRQPFFLYLHVLDPHAPYDPPPPFDTRFPRSPAFPPEMSIGHYDGEVAFVDAQFGRLLDGLREHGLAEDTLTIFVADHGEELLDHGSFGHGGTLFEEVVRIPLVIRFPGGTHAGARIGARATLSDLAPTILSAVGQPPAPEVDGRDLTELLDGSEPSWSAREMFLSLRTTGPRGNLVRGVLAGPHKYLRRSRPTASESLYDLDRDPAETEDLSSVRGDARTLLSARLDTYLAGRSSGIHLRIVNGSEGEPLGCEVRLRTTGRFLDVSGVRLEDGDGFELSDDGRRLRLRCRLENRIQTATTGPRLIPDEDGLVLQVDPPGASVVVERARLADGTELPLRAGARRAAEQTPFAFRATDAEWSVRDVDALPSDGAGAYLGVVGTPPAPADLPAPILERLRALGYTTQPD